MLKKTILATFLGAALLSMNTCHALTVYDPTNYSANVETKVQMIQQVLNSAEQIDNQLRNMKRLDWSDLETVEKECDYLFKSIDSVRSQAEAIGEDWTKTYAEWNEINPDYTGWDNSMKKYTEQADKSQKRWDKTLLQALTMAGLTSNSENTRTAEVVLKAIKASNNAEGTVQALQAATQLNGIQIVELQKMQSMYSEMVKMEALKQQRALDQERRAKKLSDEFARGNKEAMEKDVTIKNKGEKLPTFRSH